MKRIVMFAAAALVSVSAFATGPKAIYVKNDNGFRKYSFGVASPIILSPDRKFLHLSGYDLDLSISDLKYISFDMPRESQLSSTQHKDRLIQIGEKVNSMVNVNDMRSVIGMCVEFEEVSDYDWSEVIEEFKADHPDLFDDDDDYYKSPVRRLMNVLKSFAKGSPAAARKTTKVYTESFNTRAFTGVFTANNKREVWVKAADADYLELNFTGKKSGNRYSVRVTTSAATDTWKEQLWIRGDEYKYDYDSEDLKLNLTLDMPETIETIMKVNDKIVASMKLDSSLNQSAKSMEFKTTVSAVDKYVVECDLLLTDSRVDEKLVFSVGGKAVTTQTVTLNCNNLLDGQSWVDNIQGEKYEDSYDIWYEPDYRSIVARFKDAVSHTDILGELQVEGHGSNFLKMYDVFNEEDDDDDDYRCIINHDKGTVTYTYGSSAQAENQANVINNYTDASFFYDGTGQLQGFLSCDVVDDLEDYGYTTDGYWDENDNYVELTRPYMVFGREYLLTPMLNFADGSSFAFDGDYFVGGNFNILVTDYENIVETCNSIISGFRLDD